MRLGGATPAEKSEKMAKGGLGGRRFPLPRGAETAKRHCAISGSEIFTSVLNETLVSVHRAPHLLCCWALELQKYVCAPDALHLRHPVYAYN